MAGREDEAQAIVADVIVEGGREIRLGMLLPGQELGTELLMLAVQQLAAAKLVDGAPLRGGHQPGARVVGNARLGPPLERGDQRVLRQVLRQADVARHAREPGDEPGRLDAPYRVDGAVRVGRRFRHPTSIWRKRSTASLGPKSSSSNSWRTSISPSLPSRAGLGKRRAHSMASSFDFTWMMV